MAVRLGFFRAMLGAPRPDAAAFGRVKAWTLAVLNLPEDAAVTVNEIACTDPSCPGLETVMLVMEPGRKTRAFKVPKAVEAVTEQDVRAALV